MLNNDQSEMLNEIDRMHSETQDLTAILCDLEINDDNESLIARNQRVSLINAIKVSQEKTAELIKVMWDIVLSQKGGM